MFFYMESEKHESNWKITEIQEEIENRSPVILCLG